MPLKPEGWLDREESPAPRKPADVFAAGSSHKRMVTAKFAFSNPAGRVIMNRKAHGNDSREGAGKLIPLNLPSCRLAGHTRVRLASLAAAVTPRLRGRRREA
jgi:hypothetical protein